MYLNNLTFLKNVVKLICEFYIWILGFLSTFAQDLISGRSVKDQVKSTKNSVLTVVDSQKPTLLQKDKSIADVSKTIVLDGAEDIGEGKFNKVELLSEKKTQREAA